MTSGEVADRLAIEQLEARYCRSFDERNADAWAALFTPTGRYRTRGAPPGGDESGAVHLVGREALATFCRAAPFSGVHLLHVADLTLDGDAATGRIHYEHVGAFEGRTGLSRSVGYYDVRYERIGGRWLIADKVTTVFAMDGVIAHGYPTTSAFDGG